MIWDFRLRVKHVQCRFASGSSWSHRLSLLTNRKWLSLKVFCVSSALYISTLLTIDNGILGLRNFAEI